MAFRLFECRPEDTIFGCVMSKIYAFIALINIIIVIKSMIRVCKHLDDGTFNR